MDKNLPTNHLAPQSRTLLVNAVLGACSVIEAREMAKLPIPEIRVSLGVKLRSLGQPLTRPECDAVLKDLALVLPRANLAVEDVSRMCDLYFGLLREAGITGAMLLDAAKRFVMAPRNGKSRFFPDPGELAELCADDARMRRRSMSALQAALHVVDGQASPPPGEDGASPEMAARLATLGEEMRFSQPASVRDVRGRRPVTARPETPESLAELRALAKKRAGGAA